MGCAGRACICSTSVFPTGNSTIQGRRESSLTGASPRQSRRLPEDDRGVFRKGSKAKRAAWGSGNNSCRDGPIVATPISNPGTPFAPGAVPQSRVWSRLCRLGLAGGRHWETGMLECGWPIGSATLRHGSWPPSASHGLAGTRTHALISCHGPHVLVSASALHQGTTRQVVISSALALSVSICNIRQPCNKWTRPSANTPAPPRPHRPLSILPTLSTVRSDVPSRAEASSRCTARPATTRTMKDPVARTASPYVDPTVKGPRSQQLHSGYSAQARKSKSSSPSSSPPLPRANRCWSRLYLASGC